MVLARAVFRGGLRRIEQCPRRSWVSRPFRERTWIIDLDAFRLADVESDPFDDRPVDPISCTADGHIVEVFGGALVYSVYTDRCRYVTAVQPSLVDVYVGEVCMHGCGTLR